jgi:hypothetical protein
VQKDDKDLIHLIFLGLHEDKSVSIILTKEGFSKEYLTRALSGIDKSTIVPNRFSDQILLPMYLESDDSDQLK